MTINADKFAVVNEKVAPRGFHILTANIGVKNSDLDFSVAYSEEECTSSAMFTQSRFAGASVLLNREDAELLALQGVVTVSKNANVATGMEGYKNAEELRKFAKALTGISERNWSVASTGVIGVQYPMERMSQGMNKVADQVREKAPTEAGYEDFEALSRAIMTTDTVNKISSTRIKTLGGGGASIVAVGKGVGMIEPNMATMIVYFFADAKVQSEDLNRIFRRVVAKTFNSMSVDTDQSTSDTTVILANGLAGEVELPVFEDALYKVARSITLMQMRDGEGAEKLIAAEVSGAVDEEQAKTVAKAIVNSPLVKTAVHGADPNWGRVAMAVGKTEDERIDQEKVTISFGEYEMYPKAITPEVLQQLEEYLKGDTCEIMVDLGLGDARWVCYGCDLTSEYIHINADYTT